MSSDPVFPPSSEPSIDDIRHLDEGRVKGTLEAIVRESEVMRLRYMQSAQSRHFLMMGCAFLLGFAGAGGFGWFFLIHFNLHKALVCFIPAFTVPLMLHFWSQKPIEAYRRDFKRVFMPSLAKGLGGFQFYPARGVSAKVLGHTGIIPPHDIYKAEDCFLGTYKGVKVIFSEARLFGRKSRAPLFRGIFVLLETPQSVFEGHTIITADKQMVQNYAGKRWKNHVAVPVDSPNPSWNRFQVYSDKPDVAQMLCGEKLLKELSEACDAFGGTAGSAAFFGGKYVFIMIPENRNMFEPCEIHVPVTVRSHVADLRREIVRLLEIIDIIDIYRSGKA